MNRHDTILILRRMRGGEARGVVGMRLASPLASGGND
jgi:hypothetical protein